MLADLLSLSLPLFLSLSFPLTQIYVQEEHGWMIDGPGRAGRRSQASIAASHAPSLAVPCKEERIPRCGHRPAKLIKFTLGLQLVYTWFATGTEMFTSEDTKQQKKFALLQNKFAFLPNKFAFWQNKFTFWRNKFAF